jgi:hypothetical protein
MRKSFLITLMKNGISENKSTKEQRKKGRDKKN